MAQSSANNASASCSCPIMKDGPEKRPGTGMYQGPPSSEGLIDSTEPICQLHRWQRKPSESAANAAVTRFLIRRGIAHAEKQRIAKEAADK